MNGNFCQELNQNISRLKEIIKEFNDLYDFIIAKADRHDPAVQTAISNAFGLMESARDMLAEIKPKKVIGTSLGGCVREIFEGKIRERDVIRIIAGTKVEKPDEWQPVLNQYKTAYWHENPDEGEAIAKRLIAAGKIYQPRLQGKILLGQRKLWISPDELDEL